MKTTPTVENLLAPFGMLSTPVTTKTCRKCKRTQPIENFETPKHRQCIPCKVKLQHTRGIWQPQHPAANPTKAPGITSTVEGRAKYARELARRKAGPATRLPAILPVSKHCRRCQTRKPLIEFASWRVRICLACDGPSLDL